MGSAHSHSEVMWAAEDGRLQDLQYHLREVEPEALRASSVSAKRQAPLHLAAIKGHSGCIQALAEAGSKLNMLDKDGYSPLHLAVAHCHYSSVQTLLQMGANVNVKNRFGITPLHIASSVGHSMCIEELVRWGADLNLQESWGQTPLIITTLKGRIHAMKTLIHLGASTEPRDHHHGDTALHSACSSKDEESILILLDASADVLVANAAGHSSLGVALTNKRYHLVPLLIEYGARLNRFDRQHLSQKVQDHIDCATGTAVSLLRLCRVSVRQMLGPMTFDSMLPSLQLPPSLADYMGDVLALCDGTRVEAAALQGGAEEYRLQHEAAAPAHNVIAAAAPARLAVLV